MSRNNIGFGESDTLIQISTVRIRVVLMNISLHSKDEVEEDYEGGVAFGTWQNFTACASSFKEVAVEDFDSFAEHR